MAAATEGQAASRPPATLVLTGDLVFSGVSHVLQQAYEMLRQKPHDTLDLTNVALVDSAGLACVLAVMAEAQRCGGRLRVVGVSDDLMALARVSEVDHLLSA